MGFGSDGAGTRYIRKKVVDYLPVGMVLAYTERETWSQYRLCVDRTTSEWTWMYEKWTVGQSGDYAKLMVGDGIIL